MSFFDPPDDPREIIGDTPAEMIEEAEHVKSLPFVWVSCSTPGWQALISVDQVNLPVPEPLDVSLNLLLNMIWSLGKTIQLE